MGEYTTSFTAFENGQEGYPSGEIACRPAVAEYGKGRTYFEKGTALPPEQKTVCAKNLKVYESAVNL